MGIIGNGSIKNFGAFRYNCSGAQALTRGNLQNAKPALWRNWVSQEGLSTAYRTAAKPTGYYPTGAWRMPIAIGEMSITASGSGSIAVSLVPARPMTLAITGSGSIHATAGLVVLMSVGITGSGHITANIKGSGNMTVAFTGNGTMAAAIRAFGNMLTNLEGSGHLAGTIFAFGDMDIDILVTGAGLSTANVGQAVWSYLISNGLTAAQAQRVLTAIAVGKTTIDDHGGGSATVTFRNPNDTVDAVIAEMQNSERQSVTLDVSE